MNTAPNSQQTQVQVQPTLPATGQMQYNQLPPYNNPGPAINNYPPSSFSQDYRLGRYSKRVICENCKQSNNTETLNTPGPMTYLVGLGIFCLGGVCGCCLIPCLMGDCQDVLHRCSKCKHILGETRWILDR